MTAQTYSKSLVKLEQHSGAAWSSNILNFHVQHLDSYPLKRKRSHESAVNDWRLRVWTVMDCCEFQQIRFFKGNGKRREPIRVEGQRASMDHFSSGWTEFFVRHKMCFSRRDTKNRDLNRFSLSCDTISKPPLQMGRGRLVLTCIIISFVPRTFPSSSGLLRWMESWDYWGQSKGSSS